MTTKPLDDGFSVLSGGVEPLDRMTGEVDSLYVVPSHRGSGVGHALMSAAMDWFSGQAARSIAVEVISGNDAAQQFYARYGFLPRRVRLLRPGGSVA